MIRYLITAPSGRPVFCGVTADLPRRLHEHQVRGDLGNAVVWVLRPLTAPEGETS